MAARVFTPAMSGVLTFVAVVAAWVFFRAPSFHAASILLAGMAGLHGASLPSTFAPLLHPAQNILSLIGVGFADISGTQFAQAWIWITTLIGVALLAPNTQEIMAAYRPALHFEGRARQPMSWKPNLGWAVATGGVAFAACVSILRVSEFLYWQF